jgi:hypothetical protein
MTTLKQIIFASALIIALIASAAAQEKPAVQGTSLTITAAASGERVRITAPSSIVQMRMEVYAAGGEKLLDQEIRGGNVFDWNLQDGQGQRLPAGIYVCVVTAKNVSGKITQKIGTVNVAEKSVSLQRAASLSAPQTQTIGPVEDNSSWTIAGDEPQTTTVIAHDGTDGQMIRGRGALSFRIGNFFTGVDTEQMRLTEAGDLGIGTSEPNARLDVAGTIRAERFLLVKPAKPGSASKTGTDTLTTNVVDPGQSLISGTGTQNRIAKWTDNATLGDSGITETAAGLVGIGTTTPDSKLVVSSNSSILPPATGVARFADADGGQTAIFADAFGNNAIFNVRRANGTAANPSALQANQLMGVIGASGYGASAYMGTRARVAFWASEPWTNTANGTYLTFNTTGNGAATPGGTERMRIDNDGNVTIGTISPNGRLQVKGGIFAGYAPMQPGSGPGIAVDAETNSGGEAIYAECLQANNNCYALEGYAPQGDYAAYMYGGKGVYAESDDAAQPGLDGNAYGINAYGVSGESASYRGMYAKSDSNSLYSLFVDSKDGPTQTTAALNVRGTIRGEGNLVILGSKAGYVVDIMQNQDSAALEPGDVVVIVGNAPPVQGQIPVVTVKKASGAYDTAVAGVVDAVWYAPDAETKTAYEAQESAARAARDARNKSRASARIKLTNSNGLAEVSTRRLKTTDPEVAMPEMKVTDEQGTLHELTNETSASTGGYVSVVTLGAYKMVKVDASFGAIKAGDLLTTSTRPGYAMKVNDKVAAIGAIIGKALGNLDSGTGAIPVMVMPK